MRIPNKFNGYFADGRRLYNDPATVTVTLAGMEGAATTAATMEALGALGAGAGALGTIAEGAGAAVAPELAAAVTQAPQLAYPISAGAVPPEVAGAGQGIMQAAPQIAPGMDQTAVMGGQPGLGAPIADASTAVSSGAETAAQPTSNGVMSALEKGFNTATEYAGKAWKAYKEAPMPVQALGALALNSAMNRPPAQQGIQPDRGKTVDMSKFKPMIPTQQPFQRSYEWQNYAVGGPVETMSAINATSGNMMYPQSQFDTSMYSNPQTQRPVAGAVITEGLDAPVDPYTGEPKFAKGGVAEDDDEDSAAQRKRYMQMMSPEVKTTGVSHHTEGFGIIPRSRAQSLSSPNTAAQTEMAAMMKKYGIKSALPKALDPQSGSAGEADYAHGGITHNLGGYSDGGRLLKGPGDGVSDSIPAVIGNKQPARLADGEFVVPARIVSELGNGSTEAGARKLYGMMERVQAGRKKSVGKGKVAVDAKADKHLPV